MLNSKQRAYLRSLAQNMTPIMQLGKDGIDQNVIVQYDEVLETRELVKTSVHKTCEYDARDAAEYIASQTDSDVVQVIGNRFVLYRESKTKKKINID